MLERETLELLGWPSDLIDAVVRAAKEQAARQKMNAVANGSFDVYESTYDTAEIHVADVAPSATSGFVLDRLR